MNTGTFRQASCRMRVQACSSSVQLERTGNPTLACPQVLYVGGALAAAARLCALVLPARDASRAELHTTLVRNEAAYFGCVLQVGCAVGCVPGVGGPLWVTRAVGPSDGRCMRKPLAPHLST